MITPVRFHFHRSFAVALATFAGAAFAFGCSECGCSLSSDWAAQGYPTMFGFTTNTRFDYYDQSVLRSGTHAVNRGSITFPHDDEIQQRTLNRTTSLGLDYVGSPEWAFSALLPFHDRFHSTVAAGDTAISTSRAIGLGDVRLLARYLSPGRTQNYSLQFGLKLPTGHFDQNFATGPQTGQLLDRGLQLGSGTTNLLAGASYFARPTTHLGCFAQLLLDQPLVARAHFLPSTTTSLNAGARWLNTSSFTPQLQLNVRRETRERGAASDHANSGGVLAHLSPGLTVELGQRASGFAFVQVPVYQRVNGLQLEPRWLLSLGVQFKL